MQLKYVLSNFASENSNNKMKYSYIPSGTCSRLIEFDITDNRITDLRVTGGCHGNLQGIASLVQGQPVDEVISRLKGIHCGNKPTSCPDQIARALEQAVK